jgi:putative hydrolase of the HAD superfamily
MNKKINGVVFDLDDTLHDLRKYTFISFGYVAQRLSEEIQIESPLLFLSMCKHYDESWWRSKIFNQVIKEFYFREGNDLVKKCIMWFHDASHRAESLFQDTLPVLDFLKKKFKVGLLTDGPETVQKKKMAELGIFDYFDESVVVEGTDEKPSPKGFLKICKGLNIHPQETLFVGDNPYRDVAGALSVGMKVVWVRGTSVWMNRELPIPFFSEPIQELKGLGDLFYLNLVIE